MLHSLLRIKDEARLEIIWNRRNIKKQLEIKVALIKICKNTLFYKIWLRLFNENNINIFFLVIFLFSLSIHKIFKTSKVYVQEFCIKFLIKSSQLIVKEKTVKKEYDRYSTDLVSDLSIQTILSVVSKEKVPFIVEESTVQNTIPIFFFVFHSILPICTNKQYNNTYIKSCVSHIKQSDIKQESCVIGRLRMRFCCVFSYLAALVQYTVSHSPILVCQTDFMTPSKTDGQCRAHF
jgi:hypothetical protein